MYGINALFWITARIEEIAARSVRRVCVRYALFGVVLSFLAGLVSSYNQASQFVSYEVMDAHASTAMRAFGIGISIQLLGVAIHHDIPRQDSDWCNARSASLPPICLGLSIVG